MNLSAQWQEENEQQDITQEEIREIAVDIRCHRVVLLGRRGQLADQVTRLKRADRPVPRSTPPTVAGQHAGKPHGSAARVGVLQRARRLR